MSDENLHEDNELPANKVGKLKLNSVSSMSAEKKKKVLIGAVGGVFALVLLTQMFSSEKPVDKPKVTESGFKDSTPTPISVEKLTVSKLQSQLNAVQEASERRNKEQIAMFEKLTNELSKSNKAAQERNEKLDNQVKMLEEQLANQKKMADEVAAKPKNNPYMLPPLQNNGVVQPPSLYPNSKNVADMAVGREVTQSPLAPTASNWAGKRPAQIISPKSSVGSNALTGKKKEDVIVKKIPSSFLPMGAFASVNLITGGDFGASKSNAKNPQPTLMRISDNAFLPNDARYSLKNCAAMGSGYGELSSERVMISVTRLSCTDAKSGKVLEAPLLGFVADIDGKIGMRGKLVNREGAVMAKALAAGFVSGASELLGTQASNMMQTVTGAGVVSTMNPNNLAEAGGYQGMAKATEMIAQRYLEQAEAIFPVIEVDSGRKATIVIQIGQMLEWQESKVNKS